MLRLALWLVLIKLKMNELKSKLCSIGLFAKFPQTGCVKTRLIPLLGEEGATQFARYLILSFLQRLLSQARTYDWQVNVWYSGGCLADWKNLCKPINLSLSQCLVWQPQLQGHLGQRLSHALKYQLQHSQQAILVGADAIEFNASTVQVMYQHLVHHPLVFVPAHDGGYVAVGATQVQPCVFDASIHWGTHTVLAQSLEHASRHQIQVSLLPAQLDLDTPADFELALSMQLIPNDWATAYA